MVKESTQNQSTIHATKLFLPSWWVRAFDLIMAASEPHKRLRFAEELKVLPILDEFELSSLAMFNSKFQQSLLEGRTATKFSPEFLEEITTTGKESVIQSKVLQTVGSLRYLGKDKLFSFVEKETIFLQHGENYPTIEITLGKEGEELVLGVVDAYEDARRHIFGEISICNILGPRPPIGVAKSLWLDLNPIESAILLRMEIAMQWDLQWLHLNGTFGTGLGQLFNGLKLKLRKNVSGEFAKRIKVLEKLGKKLTEHGVLGELDEGNYLAFDSFDDLKVVWKLSNDAKNWDEINSYFESCCSRFSQRSLVQGIPDVFNKLFPAEKISQLEQLAAQLSDDAKSELLIVINKNKVITKLGLFCEIFLRFSHTEEFSLSERLKAEFRIEPDNAMKSWANFKTDIASLKGSLQELLLSKQGSMASEEFLNNLKLNGVRANDNQKSDQVGVNRGSDRKILTKPSEPQSLKTKKEISTYGLGSKLRKAASTEIERLKRHQPIEFKNLMQRYFESISVDEKETWDTVSKKMNANFRDEQLRLRLIRYMVENPSIWETKATGLLEEK